MTAYYNEIDPFAVAWLRELIKAGQIADGVVDERSIIDVRPSDLVGFTQCHFFAGIGVWSYALRRAGWPDSRPIWTMSCPCQPFSAAGAGAGFDDERHLWPHAYYLVSQCRPAVVTGEQVASKDADPWIDLVQADMEAVDYAFGAVPFPSASIGAPHIRDRTYWLAYAENQRRRERSGRVSGTPSASEREVAGQGHGDAAWPDRAIGGMADAVPAGRAEWRAGAGVGSTAGSGGFGGLDDDDDARLEGQRSGHSASPGQRQGTPRPATPAGELGGLGSAERFGAGRDARTSAGAQGGAFLRPVGDDAGSPGSTGRPGPTNGFWRDTDWLFCRDGKWRPVEPGTFPLAHGATARVGRLRGYGNAINAVQAQIFIEEALEILDPAIDGAAGHIWLTEGIFG